MSIDKDELTLEDEIIASSRRLGRPIKVLVVDDEAIYRSALAQSLSRTKALASAVSLHEADGSVKELLKLNEQLLVHRSSAAQGTRFRRRHSSPSGRSSLVSAARLRPRRFGSSTIPATAVRARCGESSRPLCREMCRGHESTMTMSVDYSMSKTSSPASF